MPFSVSTLDLIIPNIYASLVADASNDSKVPVECIGNSCGAEKPSEQEDE